MMKLFGIVLALSLLSSCVSVTQTSTAPDGTTVRQSVVAVGKTKIEDGLLDYKGVFPTETEGEPVEITSGTGVTKAETDIDLVQALTILAPLLKGATLVAP